HDSVVVEVDAVELLSELRPVEGAGDGQPDVPLEWTSPVWPYVAALAERIRLILNPEHPYNFEYAPEWKGIDKEVMMSEAARRLTFEHWPHMNYSCDYDILIQMNKFWTRWALPCQMAEAGFFHQPNKAGDDRVLCFACLVCLVCWEPSDEPWSEHERHSQWCRFIRNNANPNVPLSVTMSSLSPFAHHIRLRRTSVVSFIVSTTSNCEWIAVASQHSSRVHIWRSDRVVHANQYFMIDLNDQFIAMRTGYSLSDVPRRGPRVTWSDWSDETIEASNAQNNATKPSSGAAAATATIVNQSLGQTYISSSSNCPGTAATSNENVELQNSLSSQTNTLTSSSSDEMLIVAICTVGAPCIIEPSSVGAVAGSAAARCHPAIVVGIGIDSCKLSKVCTADVTPRIVTEDSTTLQQSLSSCTSSPPSYHPFIVVYQIADHATVNNTDSNIATTRTDDTKDDEMWCMQPSSPWISATPADKSTANNAGTKLSNVDDNTLISKMTALEETDFAEAMLLMESENEALEWCANASEPEYEHQTMLEEGWDADLKEAPKFDEKTSGDFVSVNYDPSPVNVVLMQCFRLPTELDDSTTKIKAILPTSNGMHLVVGVTRDAATSKNIIRSAIIVYRLIFTQYITSVQEEPCKIYFDIHHYIEQILLINTDAFSSPSASSQSEPNMEIDLFESVIIRTNEGEVFIIDVERNVKVKLCDEKAKHIALMENGKVSVITENGKVLVLQVEQMCSCRIAEEENEDETVAALLSDFNSSSELPLTTFSLKKRALIGTSSSTSSATTIDEVSSLRTPFDHKSHQPSRMQILAMQPLSSSNLRKLWELTRSDGGSSLLLTQPGTLSVGGTITGFHVVPPLGWNEVHFLQKIRKNPQHWLRSDRTTRTWHLQPDACGLPNVQAFELHLQTSMQLSHVNVRFAYHQSCIGCPDLQVTVLRRRIVANKDPTKTKTATSSASNIRPASFMVDIADLRDQCDIMAGPLLLADYIEIGRASSIIQLPGRIFTSVSQYARVNNKIPKTQTLYLVIESLSEVSFEQLIAAHKIRDREKSASQETSSKTRSLRRRGGAAMGDRKSLESKATKKTHLKSDLPPTGNTRGSGAPYMAPRFPFQSSSSTAQARKGIEWIEEISISLLRIKKASERHERIQRRMMIETTDFHARLVKLTCGRSNSENDTSLQQYQTNGVRLLNEHRALDLLTWLLDNWSVLPNAQYIVGVTDVIVSEMDNILVNGFIFASRSIAHKWCSLLIQLLHLLKFVDIERYSGLLEAIMKSLTWSIDRLYLVKMAGALHWLLTLAFATLQMCTSLAGHPKCSQMVDSLLMMCASTLTAIGEAWKNTWNGSVHEKLANNYGLCGLPLELVMYEWPAPMLSLWTRSSVPTNYGSMAGGTSVAVMPMPVALNGVAAANASNVKYPWSSPVLPTTNFAQKHHNSNPAASIHSKASISSSVPSKDVVTVSAFMNTATAQDEIDWLDVFNMVLGDTNHPFSSSSTTSNDGVPPISIVPPPGTSFAFNSRFGSNANDSNMGRDMKRRTFLSASQLSGLLEVEPLSFNCCAASEHVKVENVDTGTIVTVNCSNATTFQLASKGPLIMKTSNSITPHQPIPPTTPMVNLQSLSARMKKIAMEVNNQCCKDVNTSAETGMQTTNTDTAQGSTTQGSSASTFGVPTTPKTTPFMTPTPLSPSHLSPINSETNLTILPEEDRRDEQRGEELDEERLISESSRNANNPLFKPAITIVPCDILKPPPVQVLSIERMTVGARKFVVLDFGVPVLLTDILIPSCAELCSLSVDVWLLGEDVDGQRIVSSCQISNKSIVLQDIACTMLIRFVKLTYVGRQLFNGPCRIPLGSFFGHRFFSGWQPYACEQMPSISIEHLRQLCEDLRCRHQLACNELVSLVEEDSADERDVKKIYKECTQLRTQWNMVRGVVERLQFDQAFVRENSLSEGGWWKCGADQLRVVSEQLFALLTQSVHLLDLRSAAAYCTMMAVDGDLAPSWMELTDVSPTVGEVNAHNLLTLDMAVRHFNLFCTTAVPKLQVYIYVDCAVWLFHHGAEMSWWPKFFTRLLTQLFSSPMKTGDEKVFMLLSFLCSHTVKSTSSQAPVMLELLQFIDEILKESSVKGTADGDNDSDECCTDEVVTKKFEASLLCSAVLLTSTAFDVIVCGKRKLDRWAFASGEFAYGAAAGTSSLMGSSSSASLPSERQQQSVNDYNSNSSKSLKQNTLSMSANTTATATMQPSNDVQDVPSAATTNTQPSATTAAELHSKVQSLWGQHLQHLQAMEAMKASIKVMSKTVKSMDDMIQKKIDSKMFDKSTIEVATKMAAECSKAMNFEEAQQPVTSEKSSARSKGCRVSELTMQQVQERFEKKLEEIHSNQTPEVTGEKIEELVKWAGKSNLLSPLKPRSSRQRQCNVRLKLPLDVCESVASGLIRTLCEHTDEIPSSCKLLICKVISRICTNASHHTIPLAAVVGSFLEQLIQIGLNSRNAVVMRSAILTLLQDVIEAEARSYAKIIAGSSRSEANASVSSSIFEGITASSVEQFCQKLTGIEYAKLADRALQRSTILKNVDERKSTGATAAASALPFAFAFMKTSYGFSIANYDTLPSKDSELESLIDQALSLVEPAELSSCAVNKPIRSMILLYLCREVIKSRIGKGEPFSNIFRWIDGVRYGEARVAAAADNVVAYAVKLCSPSLPRDAFPVTEDKYKTSISALTACLRNEQFLYADPAKTDDDPQQQETATSEAVAESTVVPSADSSSPSASTSPTIHEEQETLVDELGVVESTQPTEMIDSSNLQAIKALDTFADNMSGNITKAVLVSCDNQSDRLDADDHPPVQVQEVSSPSFDKKSKPELCTGDNNERRDLLMSLPTEKNNKQMLLDYIMISFLMQARSISEDVMVQPCSTYHDERAECQLGLRAYIRCLSVDSLADILLRHSRRHLAPWRKRTVSRPRAPESEAMRAQMGRTLPLTIAAISNLIQQIPLDSSVDYVVSLLSFFNDFHEVPDVVKRMMVDMHIVFPNEGVDAVLAFAASCERLTESFWTLLMRFLCEVANADIGPALTCSFGDLIVQLHCTSVKETFALQMIAIISDIFLKEGGFEFLPYPVEMIMQIVMKMRRFPQVYAQLPSKNLSRFVWAVISVTRDLLNSDKFVRNEHVTLVDGGYRADLCFQLVKMTVSDTAVCEKDSDGNVTEATDTANDSEDLFKPYWSVSQLPLERINICESTSQLRYYEEMVGTLLQEVLGYCASNKLLVSDIIRNYPAAVDDLLEVLSSCSFCDRDYDSLFEERRFLNCWKPISVADYALRLFLLFSDSAGDRLEHMIGLTVECLKRCVNNYAPPASPKLSKPVAFSVVYMLLIPQNQHIFVQFGGHLVVSNEIKNCIMTSMGDWTAPESSTLVRQLASMATQISFAGEFPIAPRRPPGVKVEGLFNYAPICSITSSSSMAHQLTTLLAAAPPHRRARTANWSYHFYSNEEWLDLTLALPYQIMLHEVDIRPHPPTLNTGPSAVQLEVCSDATLSTWTLLAPNVSTLGFSKIRIPAQHYPYPINAVRIYLRRAPDSTNLGLSQILLLGTNSQQALAVPLSVSSDFRQWLAILDRLCTMDEPAIWQYACDLPRCLVALFLGRPLQTGIYRRVASLLVRIDTAKAKPNTVVELILDYIGNCRYVAPKSLEWLPEVIFTLCSKAAEGTTTPLHVKHQIQVFRQRQLLIGIQSILSCSHSFPHNQQEAVAVLMWSASCAIWNNVSDESMHFDTIAVCVEVGSKLIAGLCGVALNEQRRWRNAMCESASWLLCSLIRCAPAHLDDSLRFLGFDEASQRNIIIPSSEAMTVVGRMCQSATAIRALLSASILQTWVDYAITLCKSSDEMHAVQLTSIVECIRVLCSIEDVVVFLDSARGSALFKPLITFIANNSRASHIISSSNTNLTVNLENATIGLVCKCISVGGNHRERISNILCSLLKDAVMLNAAIQQMVLKCVLDDEITTVKLVDQNTPSFFFTSLKGRKVHPLFGCTRHERVTTVSLYSSFRDILPPCVLSANIGRRNASKDNCHEVADLDHLSNAIDYNLQQARSNETAATQVKEALTASASDSKKLVVTCLMCDAYSTRRPICGDWFVGQFIDALHSAQHFNSSSASISGSALVERDASETVTNTTTGYSHSTATNFTDGYFTLLLKVNTSTVEELKRAVEDELAPFNVSSISTSQHISTLQHFARAGGLAILAQHLQLYQPSTAISACTVSPATAYLPKKPSSGGGAPSSLQNYVLQPLMSEPNGGYIPVYFPVLETADDEGAAVAASSLTGFSSNAVPASAFGDDPSNLAYDHDFEFIDMPHWNANYSFVQKLYSPAPNPPPPYATVMPNVQKGSTGRVAASSSSYSLTTALSPHVVIAFSVLLRLDGYAELLVTYDRVRSKRLLRLAMGVSASEQSTLPRCKTATQHTKKNVPEEVSNDNDMLALLPFIVLERLYRMQHPDTPAGRILRKASVCLGVLDILLVCLAHYSHQKHKIEPIRPESLLPAPESVRLTEHLLRASAQIEALRAEATSNANGSGYDERMSSMNYTPASAGGMIASNAPNAQQQNFWAKGTGFGSGTTQQQWNVDAHVMKRKLDEQTVTHLLRVLASYIFPSPTWRRKRCSRSRRSTTNTSESSSIMDSTSQSWGNLPPGLVRSSSHSVSLPSPTSEMVGDEWVLDSSVVDLLARSCLLPTICAYLRNDSVLDISRHVEVYEAVVHLVAAMARCPAKQNDQGQDMLAELLSQCDSGVSLLTMLKKLHGYILAYLSKLYTENTSQQVETSETKGTEETSVTTAADNTSNKGSEEGLTRLSHIIMRTCTFISRRVGSDNAETEGQTKVVLTPDEKYIEVMRNVQFQSIPFFLETARIPYHYESSLSAVGLSSTLGKRTRRLAQEVVTLSNSLPLTASSSVFVRCAEERLDVMKVLITGPSDTPYMNGCFEFDVWFPADYPNSPMHVNLETTGNHTVRFNPNLYNDGKVCLSVLNTWHGRPEERWNPGTSSFLQVIVSMQSLILVSEPYFNEPGYERSRCTQAGQQASRDYDANIRQATVKWAMLEMIRHPPPAFRDVITRHFWLKRDEIIAQITEWIREMTVQLEEQRGVARTLQAHLSSLKRHFTALQDELARMERPAGVDEDVVSVAQSSNVNPSSNGTVG
ncbi:unnamed protein product, partial [Anisakis simplex]|uniref:UBIQUITIN_CONJUGAT_2 domain-containing protein n=1 Tax=Anisakis simplex TaxID=6269 RepID=A0A0M3JUC8_ANISI